MPGNFCSCCKEVMYGRKKKVVLVLMNMLFRCLVEIDLFWLSITETVVLMSFFFLNWKLFLPESLIHKQNSVSCKTKQTLPIRLPLWGSVQCWYFHESVFQNLKGNNIRLYGWWLAGKTTKSVLLLDNMTFVVLLIFNLLYLIVTFFLLKWHQLLNFQLKK